MSNFDEELKEILKNKLSAEEAGVIKRITEENDDLKEDNRDLADEVKGLKNKIADLEKPLDELDKNTTLLNQREHDFSERVKEHEKNEHDVLIAEAEMKALRYTFDVVFKAPTVRTSYINEIVTNYDNVTGQNTNTPGGLMSKEEIQE